MGKINPSCITADDKYMYGFASVYKHKKDTAASIDDPKYNLIIKSSVDLETYRRDGWSFVSAIPSKVTRELPRYGRGIDCHIDTDGVITVTSIGCAIERISDPEECIIQWSPNLSDESMQDTLGSGGWSLINIPYQNGGKRGSLLGWGSSELVTINNQLTLFTVENNWPSKSLNYTVFDKSAKEFREESKLMSLDTLGLDVQGFTYPGNGRIYFVGATNDGISLATTPLNSTSLQNATYNPSPVFHLDPISTDATQACNKSNHGAISVMSVIDNSTYVMCSATAMSTLYHHDGVNWTTPINIARNPQSDNYVYHFTKSTSGQLWVHITEKYVDDFNVNSIEIYPNNTVSWNTEKSITLEEDFASDAEVPKSNRGLTIGLSVGGAVLVLVLLWLYMRHRRRRSKKTPDESTELSTLG